MTLDAKTPAKTKCCTKCGKTKRLAEFSPHHRYTGGLRSQCKKCLNAGTRDRAAKKSPRSKAAYTRKAKLKQLYGITPEEYDTMLERQGGGCAICGYIPKPGGRRLAVDHNHKTKAFRGILCHMCNRGLAHFRDKPDRLHRAGDYIAASLK